MRGCVVRGQASRFLQRERLFFPHPVTDNVGLPGIVQTSQGSMIKLCAGNKQRWLGLKGISHDTNITNLRPMSETYAEVSPNI